MRIIGYTYEADTHCISCAIKRFKADDTPSEVSNGIAGLLDREGNRVHAVFDIDEGAEDEHCGDCGDQLIGG